MFRKVKALVLALLILVSNVGLAFNVHYCGGIVASVSSIYVESDGCGMENAVLPACDLKEDVKDKGCCNDKLVSFQSKEDKSIPVLFSMPNVFVVPPQPALLVPCLVLSEQIHVSFSHYNVASNGPPLFQLYSQYIFYA